MLKRLVGFCVVLVLTFGLCLPAFAEKAELLNETLRTMHEDDNGKSVLEISKEYDIGRSVIYKWIYQSENSGSFKTADNRTPEENELISLKKRNKELEMEVDILKQAALIMGRKSIL